MPDREIDREQKATRNGEHASTRRALIASTSEKPDERQRRERVARSKKRRRGWGHVRESNPDGG